MIWLVLETFVLLLAFTAAGIVSGIVLRRVLSDRSGATRLAAAGGAPSVELDPLPPTQSFAPLEVEPVAVPTPEVVEMAADLPEPPTSVIDPSRAAAADQVGVRPEILAGPRDGMPDDLKLIKGIGPQNEARLNALGIYHFEQIAAWTPEEARWVGSYLAFPGRIEREDWVTQAASRIA
ncbi:hypothetical protein [Chthonobacter albigriseus]|uniref:hypothetical protein n=1 Tax=Chthonobacter albigriseus TaxID=1683161 RepID=UPI003CC7D590